LPYTQEHKAKTRERIVGSAWRLFNRHGFAGVSIDEIMADAGLTRGGFYNHFATKDELYAEVVTFALASRKEEVATGACVRPRSVREFVSLYLSQAHFDNRETCCPLMALPSDVARGGEPVKRAYRQVLEYMIENFEKGLAGPEARKQAIALASLCVGAMAVARAVDDGELAAEIRDAAKDLATALAASNARRVVAAE
jgi:TetR/AcrR family transcriptional regulator, transcriptional repressor for nem operon